MMKMIWLSITIACCCVLGFAQDNKIKAGFILHKAKQESFKNTDSIDRIFVESASRYTVRKAKLKPGIIPSYEYRTKLWMQKPNGIKLKTLTNYPGGDSQLTEDTIFGQAIQKSIKVKGPSDNGFSPVLLQERGDAKRNEQILLQKTKYEAFSRSFPVLLFSNEELSFEYSGVAKSGNQNADVLATSIADIYKIKLFFDQKTHQLLLMSASFADPKTGEEVEHKYFFSDYKEENGVNFAHKIIIHENGEIIEERDIKAIELNPKVEPNFFAMTK
jgi:hypothetical protein